MVKITSVSDSSSGRPVRKAKSAGKGFSVSSSSASSGASAAAPTEKAAATSVMNALLDLQAAPGPQTFAAAQRTLDEMDRLQLKLLDGEVSEDDLSALARAASVRPRADADAGLLAVYDEIALRARVELAKMGR